MADFNHTRWYHTESHVCSVVLDALSKALRVAEAMDAAEVRFDGQLELRYAGYSTVFPVHYDADLHGEPNSQEPQDGPQPAPFEATAETTVGVETEAGGVDECRLEALRQAVAAREPDGEPPDLTVRRARAFTAFLNDTSEQPSQPAHPPF